MSREAAIVDDGEVLAEELDHARVSQDAAAPHAARAGRPAPADLFFDPGREYVRLSGRVSFADLDRVAS